MYSKHHFQAFLCNQRTINLPCKDIPLDATAVNDSLPSKEQFWLVILHSNFRNYLTEDLKRPPQYICSAELAVEVLCSFLCFPGLKLHKLLM